MNPTRLCAFIFRTPVLMRAYSYDPGILATFDSRSKSAKIQASIKLYLKRVQANEALLEAERKEFECGRKYLAQIMGEDPETFNQDKIDESINYLFPSALFSPRARPKLKPPEDIFPKKKELQCDSTGRPLHDLFYTRHPNFFGVMHEAVYQLETLKSEHDRVYITRDGNPLKGAVPLVLASTEWFTKAQLEDAISERITDDQFEQWLLIMERITAHPLAHLAKPFIDRFRIGQTMAGIEEKYPEPEVDPVTKQRFIKSYGQKRHSFAEVTVFLPGSGQLTVNGKRLLEFFPHLGNREQIMFPLQLTRTLGKVDIVAKVTETGTSSPANAIRLAISRCLASLLPENEGKHRLRVAGLLTPDNRYAERKNPGQKKARKKPIWKAR
ncbi:hypothetical protein P879_09916 [Paragonimus westermani]|uniref:Small subunit ribosomal protein S9 n=1 Tax=Paragonimus westermani TaxID=34504 RepID=A0A8T0D576_9TREM|nr:hypothetical protein P879_09916 [Paragonimus westermani]